MDDVCDVRDVSDGSNFIRRVAQKGMPQLYLTRLAFVFVGALDKSLVRPLSLFNQEKNTRRRTRQTTTGKIYVSLKALSPSELVSNKLVEHIILTLGSMMKLIQETVTKRMQGI